MSIPGQHCHYFDSDLRVFFFAKVIHQMNMERSSFHFWKNLPIFFFKLKRLLTRKESVLNTSQSTSNFVTRGKSLDYLSCFRWNHFIREFQAKYEQHGIFYDVQEVKGTSGPRLLVGGPVGLLDFVLRALLAPRLFDPRK